MDCAVSQVMDSRLGDLLARWRDGGGATGLFTPLVQLAPHADHLLLIEVEKGGFRYLHYGKAFVAHFGTDLTGQAISALPSEILSDDRRGLVEFDYAFVLERAMPLWRSYTADFGPLTDGHGGLETWQRLILPVPGNRLVVGACPVTPRAPRTEAEELLHLVLERVPVVLDGDGHICDLALTLRDYSDSRRQAAELEILANQDALTGTANLRHFHRLARLELQHARRMNRSLAMLALDLDHFKRINDNWGHAAGDAALKTFAVTCRQTLREPDILGRCGGEEFAIALPNTGTDGALIIAERLRRAIEDLRVPLPDAPTLNFTVSIGVAVTGPGQEPEEAVTDLMSRADHALYAAKRAGRNRVSMADPVTPLQPNG